MTIDVVHSDCLDAMRDMAECSVDAVVTDPPYELGFMGRAWDRAGVAFQLETWHAVLRVLKPGGHLLAFGGTRTSHRLVCAVEDAGFEIRDEVVWLYGSGFPKSLNLDGGLGTALKPAHEPIVVARKPLVGSVAANVLAYGTGALHIDATRIDGAPPSVPQPDFRSVNARATRLDANRRNGEMSSAAGRWPANVVLDEAAAEQLDTQTGTLSTHGVRRAGDTRSDTEQWRFQGGSQIGDSGGASRFFYTAKASSHDRGPSNHHPTVKPVELMRWLIRLVTPPDGTVLDPFAGSGTTGVAAVIENRRCILIEREGEYVEIIRRRSAQPIQPVLG